MAQKIIMNFWRGSNNGSEIMIAPELVEFENNGAETMKIQFGELPEDAPANAEYYFLTLFRR